MRHLRAIEDLEKEERKQHILKAAAELFGESSYNRVSMQDVARKSGIAKGTVYLYFQTKEELFLALLNEAFSAWFANLQQRLQTGLPLEEPARAAWFTHELTESLQAHTLLVRLLPILHTVLEYNIPYPTALAFKQQLQVSLLETGVVIEQAVGFLHPGQGVQVLIIAYAQVIGPQSMADSSPVIEKILEGPGMELFRVNVMAELAGMVYRVLTGYSLENERLV
jgi:AcrR family transcriptional regulator